ncbi:MAG: DUF2065 domain-containing protein [Gammaproteobacteria bacterium]|nr:DUF2065 domain-containing protein [Gammaproteobacteria bacterium]
MWSELFIALALLLVIEGVTPFISPAGLRRTLSMVMQMSDHSLRMAGLASMLSGLFLLYLVR